MCHAKKPAATSKRFHHLLAAFRADGSGAAVVEFAMLLPLLLLLYVGSVEVSELIVADRRINTISGTVGDLVARSDGVITEAQLTEYTQAAEPIIQPFPETSLMQVVTCVFIDADGNTSVEWSRGFNDGTPYDDGDPYPGLAVGASDMNLIARGGYVIASETYYSYTPIFGFRLNDLFNLSRDMTSIDLYHENFYMPRFGDIIELVP